MGHGGLGRVQGSRRCRGRRRLRMRGLCMGDAFWRWVKASIDELWKL